MIKIVATSDLHGHLPDLNENGDILIDAGDITLCGKYDYIGQANFLNTKYLDWCAAQRERFQHVITIAGNHDMVLEQEPTLCMPFKTSDDHIYLEDSFVDLFGYRFWGSPWSVPFYGWAFNGSDAYRKRLMKRIPNNTDVIISHGPPPLGSLDVTVRGDKTGCVHLSDAIRRCAPRYVFCGHIHEGFGHYQAGITDIYNVSYVDVNYRPRKDGYAVVTLPVKNK